MEAINLEWYDGTTEPDEHRDAFLTHTNLYTNNDAILRCVFPTSLKGATLTWYDGLPPRSIDKFNTLIERFSAKYTTNRSHRMTLVALASLRQVDNKSLRKLMDRFGRIVVQIQNLNPEVALHSMLLALRFDKFMNNLCKPPSPPVAWSSCASEPRATSRWKKCPNLGIKSDKSNKSTTSEKEVPRPTYTSRTRGIS